MIHDFMEFITQILLDVIKKTRNKINIHENLIKERMFQGTII